ncbi:MAG: multidrug effflux MFS transporter [Paracoccaceae bacterium]|nr:multidrug effflux MFS transporter [Paracoccaceae bacterium]
MNNLNSVRLFDRTTPPHILTLVLLAGLPAMNMSIFLPSLQNMTDYFQTDYALMQLSVSGYLAATAVLQVIVGPISDRFGRRPVILWSIVLFCLATLGCLLSTSIEMFLAFRLLQCMIVAAMVLSRAVVRDMVNEREAASMIGYVTMGMALVPMVGPMIGGALDQLFDWRATFVFLIIAGVGTWIWAYADLKETLNNSGVTFGEQVRTYPELFTSRRFWGYVLCAAFVSGAFFAFLGGAPFVAAETFGLNPVWTGIALGAPAIGYAFGNFLSGRFSTRMGLNWMVLTGTLITTTGMLVSLLLALSGISGALIFFGFCTFVGVGNGMVMPNATAGMLSVRPHLAGTASGIGGSILIGGGAAMAAFTGPLLEAGQGALPLQWIMFLTAAVSIMCIGYVIRREQNVVR